MRVNRAFLIVTLLVLGPTALSHASESTCANLNSSPDNLTKCWGKIVELEGTRNTDAMFMQRTSGTWDTVFIQMTKDGIDIGLIANPPVKCDRRMKVVGKLVGQCGGGGKPHVKDPAGVCEPFVEVSKVTCLD